MGSFFKYDYVPLFVGFLIMAIFEPYGLSFHAVIVFSLDFELLY